MKRRCYIKFEVTIPVFNEEKTLRQNIEKLIHYVKVNFKSDFNICIAENGSTDGTLRITKALAEEYDCLRYVSCSEAGVGYALKKAWASSNADVIGYMDLDLSTSIDHLEDVVKKFVNTQVEFLYGSRLAKGSEVFERSFVRKSFSKILNVLIQYIFKIPVSDCMCGFKFFKREQLSLLISHGAKGDKWFFCAELVILASLLGKRVVELPVVWRDDRDSKVKVLNLSLEYIHDIYSLKKRFRL